MATIAFTFGNEKYTLLNNIIESTPLLRRGMLYLLLNKDVEHK